MTAKKSGDLQLGMGSGFLAHVVAQLNHVPRAMDWGSQGCVLRCEIDSSQAMQNVPSIAVLC